MKYKSTTIWGPYVWHLMHHIAHYNNNNNIKEQIEFYNRVLYVLPCEKCKQHYSEYIENNPIRGDMKKWLHSVHNNVNIINKGEKFPYNKCKYLYNNNNFNNYQAQKFLDIITHNLENCLFDIENYKRMIRLLYKLYPDDKLRMKLITVSNMYELNNIYDYKSLFKWYVNVSEDWIPRDNNLVFVCNIDTGKRSVQKNYKLGNGIVNYGKTIYNKYKNKKTIYQEVIGKNGEKKRICLLRNCNNKIKIKNKQIMTNVDLEFIKKVKS